MNHVQQRQRIAILGALFTIGCAAQQAGAGPVGPKPEARSHTIKELTISRPNGWTFVPGDASLGSGVEVMLTGPMSKDSTFVPYVEFEARALDAAAAAGPSRQAR